VSPTGADGKPIEMRGKSIEVAKRQSDGGWRFVIDSPCGGE
jgi:ketosteroid isomerase-like protein